MPSWVATPCPRGEVLGVAPRQPWQSRPCRTRACKGKKTDKDDSGKKKKCMSIPFTLLNRLRLKHQLKRENSSNHANQRAPQPVQGL